MLKARHLYYRYSQKHDWIITDASLTLCRGKITGLYGYSGEGKTTLAKLASGYLKPDRGTIRVDDRPMSGRGYSPVQMVFQHPEKSFNPTWKIIDSLKEAGPVSKNQFARLGVENKWLYKKPHELSGGELQRISIARVLRPETCYLVADEITTMLDVFSQAKIWELITCFSKKHNIGVLAISHNMPLMKKVCDNIINMAEIQHHRNKINFEKNIRRNINESSHFF